MTKTELDNLEFKIDCFLTKNRLLTAFWEFETLKWSETKKRIELKFNCVIPLDSFLKLRLFLLEKFNYLLIPDTKDCDLLSIIDLNTTTLNGYLIGELEEKIEEQFDTVRININSRRSRDNQLRDFLLEITNICIESHKLLINK